MPAMCTAHYILRHIQPKSVT